jgi:hypothetical protein
MEYDVALWTALTSLVLQAIALIPRDPGKRTREDEQALKALSDAYHATQAYYSSRHGGAAGNRQREWEIANLWDRLSIQLRKRDERLASQLGLKSRYWREGALWNDEQIRDAGIGLEQIWAEANVLLNR